jgi:hypothetical protein
MGQIKFTKRMTVPEFDGPFLDACKAYLMRCRWPDGVVKCPRCGSDRVATDEHIGYLGLGSFHHVSAKYLPLYVAEFAWRYNNRKNADIFGDAIALC